MTMESFSTAMTLSAPSIAHFAMGGLPVALQDGFPALKNHLWQSTLFACAAALLALALRHNHARIRYWLWLAASAKFLIPFSLLVALGGHLTPPHRPAPTPPALYSTIEEFSQPFTQPSTIITPPTSAPAASPTHLLPLALASLWLAGFIALALRSLLRWRQLRTIVRAATPVHEGREVELLRRLTAADRATPSLPILISRSTLGPGIYGILRPVLLWPAGISQRLSDAHLESILSHELAHVRRRDNLAAALHMLVEAIFWFHPMVWWLGSRLMAERERACDEAVLQSGNTAQITRQTYAESILKVCEFYLEPPLACVSGITAVDLESRIAAILSERPTLKLNLARRVLLLAATGVAIATPILIGVLDTREGRAQGIASTILPMSSQEKLQFDVATIRLNKLGIPPAGPPPMTNVDLDPGEIYGPTGGIFRVQNKSLRTLIAFAYKMNGNQQLYLRLHVPSFVLLDRFDAEARSENHTPTKDQMRLMVRSLLEDRFKLRVHTESQPAPVLALMPVHAGKLGPQIRPHPADDPICKTNDFSKPPSTWVQPTDGYPPFCGTIAGMRPSAPSTPGHNLLKIGGRNVSMALLAEALVAPYTGDTGLTRPVIDASGLTGTFDFTLELEYAEMSETFTAMTAPNFLEELNDQLGMKLNPQKGPVTVYVVDHVERLSDQDDAKANMPTPPKASSASFFAASLPSLIRAVFSPAGSTQSSIAAQTEVSVTQNEWVKAAGGKQEFDVASVKENKGGIGRYDQSSFPRSNVNLEAGNYYLPVGGLFSAYNQQLINYVGFAYKLSGSQKLSLRAHAPKWVTTDRFDIEARTTYPKPTKDQMRLMMQSLLADRFKLVVHNETQQLPVLALVQIKPGKFGPDLRPHRADDPVCAPKETSDVPFAKTEMGISSKIQAASDGYPALCGAVVYMIASSGPNVKPAARNVTMGLIASTLPAIGDPGLDRPVIDRTGLTGTYDFALELPFVPGTITASDQYDSSPAFFESIQDQLGLKLEKQVGPVDVLVIDHIDHPTAN